MDPPSPRALGLLGYAYAVSGDIDGAHRSVARDRSAARGSRDGSRRRPDRARARRHRRSDHAFRARRQGEGSLLRHRVRALADLRAAAAERALPGAAAIDRAVRRRVRGCGCGCGMRDARMRGCGMRDARCAVRGARGVTASTRGYVAVRLTRYRIRGTRYARFGAHHEPRDRESVRARYGVPRYLVPCILGIRVLLRNPRALAPALVRHASGIVRIPHPASSFLS